jgi:hypothetical protein
MFSSVVIEVTSYSHRSSAPSSRVTHNDTLRNAGNAVILSVYRGIKEMIRRFLKGGQHENAVLHLGDTEASDTQYLTLFTCELVSVRVSTEHVTLYDITSPSNMTCRGSIDIP